jgi:hypothetical protein
MLHIRPVRGLLAFASMLLMASPAVVAQHGGDVGAGRSGADQLKPKPFDPEGPPCFDPAIGIATLTFYPASNSWRTDTPGFDASFPADPPNDYYLLEEGASIRLVAYDDMQPALRVKYQSQTIVHAGDYITLGSYVLHRHATFIVDGNDPAYDALRTLWWGTFTFRDVGSTGYAESAPFTIRLCVLDPATFVLGDVSEDGVLDFGDINVFVSVLADPAAATVRQRCEADTNLDGYVTFDDINPFVALLAGG